MFIDKNRPKETDRDYLPEILNPEGAGAFVLICEHASNAVPDEWDNLGLDEDQLLTHHAFDAGAADLTRELAARLDAPSVLSRVSRLFLDYNRPAHHPSQFPREIDGQSVPANAHLSKAEIARREALAFFPMRDAVDALLDRRRARGDFTVVLSVHSCEPVFDGVPRPWPVGIISEWDRRIADRIIAVLQDKVPDPIGDNDPYDGRLATGFTLAYHGGSRRLHHAALEMRKDVLATSEGIAHWATVLEQSLSEVADEMRNDPHEDRPRELVNQ
jgi:predicted N-formylglutamate amidohydrolase